MYYPLEDEDIYLPLYPPEEKGYKFKNWENIIGVNPGESNVIKDVTCLPKAENIFIPSSLKYEGCSNKKNIFKIYGEWEDNTDYKIPSILIFSLVLSKENYDFSSCDYVTSNPIHFECEYNGFGNFTIEEQYFNGILSTYKIKKLDSPLQLEQCENLIPNPQSPIPKKILYFH